MKAVILAGGRGTRLGNLTQSIPKPMMPVAGKPIIRRIIDTLSDSGIKEIIVVVGYEKDVIIDYLRDGSQMGVDIKYVEQKQQLGTANAVLQARNHVDDKFISINGDLVFDESLIFTLLKKSKIGSCIICSKKVKNPKACGVLKLNGEKVLEIVEKSDNPPSNIGNAGIYLFSNNVFDYIDKTTLSSRGEYEITDTIQLMIEDGRKVFHHPIEGYWYGVETRDNLISAAEMFA